MFIRCLFLIFSGQSINQKTISAGLYIEPGLPGNTKYSEVEQCMLEVRM